MDGHSAASRLKATPGLRALRAPRWLLPAVAIALGYYCAARLGLAFTLQTQPISTLWPPNALLVAVLLLTPTRDWWWLLAAVLPAHLFAELQDGVPTAMVLGWYVSNCSEALIGAGLVRALIPPPLRLDSLRNAAIVIVCAVITAPLFSSFLDAGLVHFIGWGDAPYLDLVSTRFFSNVLAELMVVPLVLTWAAVLGRRMRKPSAAQLGEAALLAAGLFLVCLFVFDVRHDGAHASPALFYAPLPFLLWAAVRFGPVGIATALPVLMVATIWGAVHGLGPFAVRSPIDTARDMQLFLIAASVPLLLLAVALSEHTRVEGESRAQLTHLSRVATLGELSGGIAHELNQPLTAILSNAQAAQHFLANNTASPELLGEILQDIVLADRRAGDVIERLRAMFRREEVHVESLDMNALVREVITLTHGDLTTRGVQVELRLDAKLPAVRGDRVQLQQVLMNLLINGAEAMAESPQKDRVITIRTLTTGNKVHVNVVDRGPGFTVAPAKLFEAFYTTKPKGLGLGLSISRSIIVAHGGLMWASTRPGGGAALLITLPALRVQD
jgi:signal transduction histidine kinase